MHPEHEFQDLAVVLQHTGACQAPTRGRWRRHHSILALRSLFLWLWAFFSSKRFSFAIFFLRQKGTKHAVSRHCHDQKGSVCKKPALPIHRDTCDSLRVHALTRYCQAGCVNLIGRRSVGSIALLRRNLTNIHTVHRSYLRRQWKISNGPSTSRSTGEEHGTYCFSICLTFSGSTSGGMRDSAALSRQS